MAGPFSLAIILPRTRNCVVCFRFRRALAPLKNTLIALLSQCPFHSQAESNGLPWFLFPFGTSGTGTVFGTSGTGALLPLAKSRNRLLPQNAIWVTLTYVTNFKPAIGF